MGAQGRVSDGGVFRNSTLCQALADNSVNLPAPRTIPGCDGPALPYVVLADEAFPLKEYLMRPYPGRDLTDRRRVSSVFSHKIIRNVYLHSCTYLITLQRLIKQLMLHTAEPLPISST